MAQGEQQRGAATGGAAANNDRQGTELAQQIMDVVGPDFVFRLVAIDHDVGSAAVAPVEDDDSVSALSHFAGEQFYAANITPPAWRERDPWTAVAEYLVVDVDAANFSDTGLIQLIHLSFSGLSLLMSALALVAGALILVGR